MPIDLALLLSRGLQASFSLVTENEKWKLKSLSCVQLFVTPWTTQAVEFSRSEYWSV